MKIAIVDYKVGNVFNVQSAFSAIGAESTLTRAPEVLQSSDVIVLPGVGAFGGALENLRAFNLIDTLRDLAKTKYFLGICVGMQLLFERSEENGSHHGLAIIPGEVRKLSGPRRLPNIGWRPLTVRGSEESGPFQNLKGNSVYFCHSFVAVPKDESTVIAESSCDDTSFCAAVRQDRVVGVQFHVEKSREAGLKFIQEFLNYAKR